MRASKPVVVYTDCTSAEVSVPCQQPPQACVAFNVANRLLVNGDIANRALLIGDDLRRGSVRSRRSIGPRRTLNYPGAREKPQSHPSCCSNGRTSLRVYATKTFTGEYLACISAVRMHGPISISPRRRARRSVRVYRDENTSAKARAKKNGSKLPLGFAHAVKQARG